MATYSTIDFPANPEVKGFESMGDHKYVRVNGASLELGTFRVRGDDEPVMSIKSIPTMKGKQFPLGIIANGMQISVPEGCVLDPVEMVLYTPQFKEVDFRKFADAAQSIKTV